jgi:LDH2 family malate/lactate/ureidoglycolate dehydrogenase
MSVADIGKQGSTPTDEYILSQVVIAIHIADKATNDEMVRQIIADIKSSEPADNNATILYPYEKELAHYRESLRLGILVDENVWQAVQAL